MSARRNRWLERNLYETGLPLPGVEGVYLRPGQLAVLTDRDAKSRRDFLLETAMYALMRSRGVFLLSPAPAAALGERMRELCLPEPAEKKQERSLRRLMAEHFIAFQREKLGLPELRKTIADFTKFEGRPPGLMLIDAGVLKISAAPALAELAARSAAAWVIALNANRNLEKSARLRIHAQAAAANRAKAGSAAPAIYIS